MELRDASKRGEAQVSSWPIYQALLLGCLSLVVGIMAVAVMTTSVPRQKLTSEFTQIETIVNCLATLSVGWVFLELTHRLPVTRFLESISWRESTRSMLVWSAIGVGVAPAIQHLAGFAPHQPSLRFAINFVVATVALQPLIEEVYFRGVLFESLSNRIDYRFAITIVSVVFLLLHFSTHRWTLIPITVILAVARIATRSTANCFALHASYNLGILLWNLTSTSWSN
jgi:membrane protease YdiL (CAAX protease family)